MAAPAVPSNVVERRVCLYCTGPVILGYMLNWGLFGVVTIQVYFYYIAFPKDRMFCKCLVYGVYFLETVQTIFITHDAFASFGFGFGNFEAFDKRPLTLLIVPTLSGIVGCVVQMFYAYRINILSNTRVLGLIIATIAAAGCIGGIITGIKCFELGRMSKISTTGVLIATGFWWGCSALCDVAIALAMTYLLLQRDTGFRATHLIVTRLIRLTIETGTSTALMAIVNLGLFFGYQHTNYYTVPVLIVTKLYSNTLLVIFNSRMRIVGGREEQGETFEWTTAVGATRRGQGPAFASPPSVYTNGMKLMGKERRHESTLSIGTDLQVTQTTQ